MTDKQWPADSVVRRKVDDLIPYAKNSRTHSDEQVGQIAASIKEWGFTTPILIDPEGGIIAGHGRLMAAQKLGLDEVPTMTAHGWTDAQKRAYIIADNKLAMNAGWDLDMLKVEFKNLGDLSFDLALTGFGLEEIAGMFLEPSETEPVPFDVEENHQMIVSFETEAMLEEWFQKIDEMDGATCKLL